MANRKKLVFDVTLRLRTLSAIKTFTCTRLSATVPASGDRWNNLMGPEAAATDNTPLEQRHRTEIAGWFVPVDFINEASLGTVGDAIYPRVSFVGGASGAAITFFSSVVGGGAVAAKAGHSAIFSSHFATRLTLQRFTTTPADTLTVTGCLYVQKQHSIEA